MRKLELYDWVIIHNGIVGNIVEIDHVGKRYKVELVADHVCSWFDEKEIVQIGEKDGHQKKCRASFN